jgi:SAM-dependent methyltransferase
MTADLPLVTPAWLALREPADAAARAPELAALVRRHLAAGPGATIHNAPGPLTTIYDLGCGSGSMGRWLAPRLPGPQHWIMYDRDPGLLELARAGMVDTAADGAPVTVETRQRDITRLTAADLDGACLVTASALLDMLTAEEVERVVAACAGAGCPTLLTLSVTGRVEITPSDPLDATIAEAFNAHQRRMTGGRRLLGPDAVEATADAYRRRGTSVLIRSSPWRLGVDQVELMSEWLEGWLAAACGQRPDLRRPVAPYARRRLAAAAAGRLQVVVGHGDLLAGCE